MSAESSPSPQQLTGATRAINSQAALVQLGGPRVDDGEQRTTAVVVLSHNLGMAI